MSTVRGLIRIPWLSLRDYTWTFAVPDGAHVIIDLAGIDDLPDKLEERSRGNHWARDKFDFLDHADREALTKIADTAGRIDVDGEGHHPERIAAMVRFLRGVIEEQEGAA